MNSAHPWTSPSTRGWSPRGTKKTTSKHGRASLRLTNRHGSPKNHPPKHWPRSTTGTRRQCRQLQEQNLNLNLNRRHRRHNSGNKWITGFIDETSYSQRVEGR